MILRPYQKELVIGVEDAWERYQQVLACMATGGGKTPTLGQLVLNEPGASVVIAHRSELVAQASTALATYGIRHKVIGPPILAATCAQLHLSNPDIGASYVSPNAKCAVAGVDTLIRMNGNDPWFNTVRKTFVDEGHHLQAKNKWGRAVGMFNHPAVRGLALTATPGRPDGRGLGRWNDGLCDTMVHGPGPRWLIKAGYLTPYRIFAPPSDVDYSGVHVTASGDLSPPELSAAVHKSKKIVGDIVDHYLQITPGKLGVTFCVDIEACKKVVMQFRERGVPAEIITGETPPAVRANIMRRFRNREILQLVNVDILGEGVDVPAVEVVSMARRTASFIVYAQQFGRMLRLLLSPVLRAAWDTYTDAQRREFIATSEKPFGTLIDHVGNVALHGLPDTPRQWSLERREKRSRGAAPSDVEPQRTCLILNKETGVPCMFTYARVLPACPECGEVPEPISRNSPKHVDGDLVELSPETLAKLRGDVDAVDGAPDIPWGMPAAGQAAARKRHYETQDAQAELRSVMEWYGGWRKHEGDTVSMTQRRFFHTFGLDVLSAQALKATEADALRGRIMELLNREGVSV